MTDFSKTISSSSDPIHPAITNRSGGFGGLDTLFTGLVWIFSLSGLAILTAMTWVVSQDAMPAIAKFGLGFLTSPNWDVNAQKFGGLPFIYGTIVSSIVALILAVPMGIAAAIATSENFVPNYVRSPIALMIELIASIPSVIIGLWGIFILTPILKPLQEWLFQHFAWFPLFGSQPLGPSMLIAGIVLAIMIIPTIAAISREVMLAIPSDLKTASRALGATRWETIIRVLLPTASSGIIGSVILALGRALGETMAVTMVIGNSTELSASLLAPGYTIPAVLANQFAEAVEALHIGALMYLALILFVITLIVNAIAVLLVEFINRQHQ